MAKKEVKPENNKKSNKKEEKNKRSFFKDFKAELKKVVWPTPKQLVNNTVAVVTIVLVIGVIVFVLDMGFEFLNKQNVKVQEKIQDKYLVTAEDTETTSTEEDVDDASSEELDAVDTTTEEEAAAE